MAGKPGVGSGVPQGRRTALENPAPTPASSATHAKSGGKYACRRRAQSCSRAGGHCKPLWLIAPRAWAKPQLINVRSARKVAGRLAPFGRTLSIHGVSGSIRRRANYKDNAPWLGGKIVEASPPSKSPNILCCPAALILAIGTVTGFVAQKCKIPDVAIFLIVGIAIGPQALGPDRYQGGFGAQPDHPAVRRELYPVRWRRLAALRYSEAGLDHDRRDRHHRRADHRGDHRLCRAFRRSACPGSWRCCWARRSPRPIRRRWCRFSGRSTFATAWRRR